MREMRESSVDRPTDGFEPPSAAIDEEKAKAASYFLGERHALIHRHLEQITIAPDHTARWELSIDIELPSDPTALAGVHGDQALFLFPLVLLKKTEARTRFEIRDGSGAQMPRPTRVICDWVTAQAAAAAARRIESAPPDKTGRRTGPLPAPVVESDLVYAFQTVVSLQPYEASVVLNEIFDGLDPLVNEAWQGTGLTEDLELMLEHWMLWLPLRGLPGERLHFKVGQDVELLPRSLYKWRVGTPEDPKDRKAAPVFATNTERYQRIGPQVDLSVLGERLALPLGWLPIEFEFPTVHTRRCSSYHFELICPNGLSPRAIKIANRPNPNAEPKTLDVPDTMGTRAGIAYLPGSRSYRDVVIRARAGIGRGAFPFLWLLTGTFTAILLWYIVATHPTDLITGESHSKNEIAAGILLIVPALLGAIAVGFEGLIARLIGGARMLLLATGLASAGAATVLIGKEPLQLDALTQWSICATVATVAAVPLTTSWLLSLPVVWRGLGRLNSPTSQYKVFNVLAGVTMLLVIGLLLCHEVKPARAAVAVVVLLMTVPLSLLAASRVPAAIPIHRHFISLGTIFAAMTCAVLGCFELHAALVDHAPPPVAVEVVAFFLLAVAVQSGRWLNWVTKRFHEKPGEVHLAPAEARALLEGKRLRELIRLRASTTEGQESGPAARGMQADWSWGVSSTVHLPERIAGEFEHMVEQWPRSEKAGPRLELELETKEKLPACLRRLRRRGRDAAEPSC